MTRATIIGGELAEVFILSREEVEQFAIARRRYSELRALAFDVLMPAIGGPANPLSGQLYDLLQDLHAYSGGFLASHRATLERTASEHGAQMVGGAQ